MEYPGVEDYFDTYDNFFSQFIEEEEMMLTEE